MVISIRNLIENAYNEYPTIERTMWVQKWPGQCVLTVSQMFWTAEVHDIFIVQKPGQMQNYHKFLTVIFFLILHILQHVLFLSNLVIETAE